jgi:hypothetical protein
MNNTTNNQLDLFGNNIKKYSLPIDYEPLRPVYLDVSRIYLAKGNVSNPERRRFVDRICRLYPEVIIEDRTEIPHNNLDLGETDILTLHNIQPCGSGITGSGSQRL